MIGTGSGQAGTSAELGFDPTDPAFIADPYPVYRRLREAHPVLWNPDTRQWLVSRHADVDRLLRDRRLGRSYVHQATHAEFGRSEPPAWHAPFRELNDAGMLDREPPDHTRLRRLVLRAFTPRTVESLRPRIEAIGAGIHYCLGAPLARLELGIAFGALLCRLPRLEPVESPTWKPTFVLRGLQALRVRV